MIESRETVRFDVVFILIYSFRNQGFEMEVEQGVIKIDSVAEVDRDS